MDGWITIGTDIDSKEFDKELKRLEKQSEKFAKEEQQLLKQKAKIDLTDYYKEKEAIKENKKEIQKLIQTRDKYAKGSANYNAFQSQIDFVKSDVLTQEELNQKYSDRLSKMDQINQKLKENRFNQEEVNKKTEEVKSKSAGIHMNFDNIGKSISDNIKKVGKWAMAIFSVRSAYSVIRQAMSTISTYNDDINNKLYSIKMMFASALEPLITRLVNLAWKLMSYIAYIAKAWFGVDLYAKSSANAMQAGAKSTEKMKKSLAGFDEANILNDNGTTGSMGASSPKIEMPETGEIPSWVQWIADNKDKVLDFFKQLAIIIGVIKLADFILKLVSIGKGLSGILNFLKPLITKLKGMSSLKIFGMLAGIVLAITGIVTATKGVLAYIKDPSWSNFNKILEGLTLTLLGVGVAMVAFNASNPVGWIIIAVGVVTGFITVLSTLAKSFFEDKAQILDTKTAQEKLTQAQKDAEQATKDLSNAMDNHINAVDRAEEALKQLKEAESRNKISGEELQKQVEKGTLSYENMTNAQKEVYKAYRNNLTAQDNLRDSQEKLKEAQDKKVESDKNVMKYNWEMELSNAKTSGSYDKLKESIVNAYTKGEISAEEARDLMERAMSGMSNDASKTFTQAIPTAVAEGLDPSRYQSTWTKFKNGFTGVFDRIGTAFSNVWNSITKKASSGIAVPVSVTENTGMIRTAKSHYAKGAIVYPKLQYHASGGIINNPGRGVPITEHIGGERGAEGILPLTDSQQMDLLGQSIAKYMTINLTNINQMNGRVISRELKKIQAEQDFATNS